MCFLRFTTLYKSYPFASLSCYSLILVLRIRIFPKIVLCLVDHGLDVAVFTEFLHDPNLRGFGIAMVISFVLTNLATIINSKSKVNVRTNQIDMVINVNLLSRKPVGKNFLRKKKRSGQNN